jgi:glycosyltransferase involved in cell wall biosynthesis
MVKYLGQRHNLTLVTFTVRPHKKVPHELLEFCTKVYAVEYGGPQPESAANLPFYVGRNDTLHMRDAIQAATADGFDVALLEQIFLAPYRKLIQAPAILGEHNVESSLLEQIAASSSDGKSGSLLHRLSSDKSTPSLKNPTKQAALLRAYEDEVWPEFSWRTAVSEADRSVIQQRGHRGETWLVENGIDPDLTLNDARPDTNNVLFMGMLGYYPNIDAVHYLCEAIWPHLSKINSSANLIVAGRAPARDITTLAKRKLFKLVANPSNMAPIAEQCSVSICPLRIGSGTRLKILESMAFGLPVVTTSVGCEGLAVEDERDLLIRDNPAEFAFAVQRLLTDAELWNKLRENAHKLVRERYSWETVLEPLDRLCRKAASEHQIVSRQTEHS